MFFLIRTAFWISLLLLVLPFSETTKGDGPTAQDKASIDAMAALAAAGATISDVTGFCSRQPDACAVGGQAIKLVGERARESASAISDYLSQSPEREASKSGEPIRTGTTAKSAVAAPVAAGRQTLTPSDRKPAWRAPGA
ncbi:DUF5330 domain-containing protein [Chelatococcus sambhunathii]|uniref:DUF5330 domain-containing protein n=1 Tax=Chelatococcus sambhunathii TaxID=363953 RepID=A0ABU1DHL4_9HYPH|nr:DUF5330 domain-containing protein [Chelatococcus sambhunathii]MDR4307489.1 DUF5330 domain-containing protein [Chelatococcus sambhunathii]